MAARLLSRLGRGKFCFVMPVIGRPDERKLSAAREISSTSGAEN